MAGLFDFIGKVVTSLFGGSDEDVASLREIHNRLKTLKPPVFRARNAMVLSGFATRVYQLSRALDPLKPVFRYTLAHEDSATAQRYQQWLIEARLPRDVPLRRHSFTYKEMKGRLAGVSDADRGFRAISNDLQKYLSMLEGDTFRNFDETVNQTLRLAHLSHLPYGLLLRRFDSRFDAERTDYRPSFNDAAGDDVLDEILDLYFLIARLKITEGVAKNVHMLALRVYRNKGYEKALIDQALAKVSEITQEKLSAEMLLLLIRVIRSDPRHNPRVDTDKHSVLGTFRKQLMEQYERDMDRLRREVNHNAIQQDVANLFQGAPLLPVEGYDDEEAALISHRNLDSFAYVFPMRILKSFTVAKYENQIKDIVKRLLVDGFFDDRKWQESLSGALFACEAILEKIKAFENQFRHGGRFSVRLIHGFLDAHEKGRANVSAQLRKLVAAINKEALEVIEEGAALYLRLGGFLGEILNDYKSRQPTRVTNIRVIAGDANTVYIKSLLQAYNDLRRVVQVMRNYAVVDQRKIKEAASAARE